MAYFMVLADTAKYKRNKNTQLLEIQSLDLKLSFELEKPSTCTINLINVCDHNHVAFKVNTTSPEKYIVHPNTGLIKPNSTSNFTVTLMQAPSIDGLADMKCEDKFLIMSKTVPLLANQDDDVTPALWTEDISSYVEENMLWFVLAGDANSPALNFAKDIELLEAMLNELQEEFSTAKADQEEGGTTMHVDVKRRLCMGEMSKCEFGNGWKYWKYWLSVIIVFVMVLLVWRFVFYSYAIKEEQT